MDLSQVMPSGCNLRRVAQPPDNQLAVVDRPSASDYQEEESVVDPADMHMALVTPAFQPYRGATGRAWMAQEYGLAVDTSSLLSSGTERDDTDDEICSFISTTDSKTSEAHGHTLSTGNRDNHATYFACARLRCGSQLGSGHCFTDSESRKKPGPRHVALPSENRPLSGHT